MLRRRTRHRHADPARLRPRLKLRLALAACGSLLVGAAGCGGEGGDETVDPALLAPSRAGYISRADGLCGFYQERTESQGRAQLGLAPADFRILDSGEVVFKPGRRPPDTAIAAFVTGVAVPNLTDELGELRAIQVPAGDEAELSANYAATERANRILAADPAQALDPARMKSIFDPALKRARGYGFRICGATPPSVPAAGSPK